MNIIQEIREYFLEDSSVKKRISISHMLEGTENFTFLVV